MLIVTNGGSGSVHITDVRVLDSDSRPRILGDIEARIQTSIDLSREDIGSLRADLNEVETEAEREQIREDIEYEEQWMETLSNRREYIEQGYADIRVYEIFGDRKPRRLTTVEVARMLDESTYIGR